MIYELRVYRVVQGRMAALHDTLRTSNLADNGPPWHPASRVLDDNRWSFRTTPDLSACMEVACTAPSTVGCGCRELSLMTASKQRDEQIRRSIHSGQMRDEITPK